MPKFEPTIEPKYSGARPDFAAIGALSVERMTRRDLTRRTMAALAPGAAPLAVAFCNAHTAEIALRDADYRAALEKFCVVNDGIGLEIAARILERRGFPENLNGTDFIPALLADLPAGARLYLLGAAPGVAEEAGRRFAARFPHLDIVGVWHGFFRPEDEEDVVRAVAAAKPDVLLVALGNPAQEMFIARHFGALGAKTMFGVGALFDFAAERVARAPVWMRRARLEWAFRLAQEPGRLLRRYTIETAAFLIAVLRLRALEEAR
ncbi:MAG TPA: WecB/TagA/CpsF family glycosyltransferase [Rhodoblastus sp.]|nr:WecB/TagA/CpsF family glycosyltransferase [Rhodoblastus sp.]